MNRLGARVMFILPYFHSALIYMYKYIEVQIHL